MTPRLLKLRAPEASGAILIKGISGTFVMTTRFIEVRGRKIEVAEWGEGEPVLYLHGMWDVHTAQAGPFPFHELLARKHRVIAPAHPGCGESAGIEQIADIDDLAFHYLDVLDALGIQRATIVGFCIGGWIATEMAVRDPGRIGRMALIGAAGLQSLTSLNGDVFMYSQHRDGGVMRELRELLFADADSPIANALVPDGRVSIADEVRRYKSLTLAGRVGWEPPYLHDRKLPRRLHRVACPALFLWGDRDRMIPPGNGEAYAKLIPGAVMRTLPGRGHSAHIEGPEDCLAAIDLFLSAGGVGG